MAEHGSTTPGPEDNTIGSGRHRSLPQRLMWQLGRRRTWFTSAAVFLVFAFMFFVSSAPFAIPGVEAACGQQPPDMRFFTSAGDVTSFLDACGPAGRDAYQKMQIADLVYPAVVGVFLASSLALVIGHLSPRAASRGSKAAWLALTPLVGSLFDYAENVFAWLALGQYPEPAATDAVLGYASAAKSVAFWASGTLLLVVLVTLGVQWVRRRVWPVSDEMGESRPTARRHVSA